MGLMNYLSPYIPMFTDKAHNLRGLLKSESQWTWEEVLQSPKNNSYC